MLAGLTAVLLAAAPAAGPVKLAAPGFALLNVSAEAGSFFTDHFAQQLESPSVRVTTANEIGALIGLERQKQLLGCKDDASSCMAELANALGVDGIVRGSVGKFGDTYQVNVKVLSARDAQTLAKYSGSVESEKEVIGELTRCAGQLRAQVLAALRPGSADAPVEVSGAATSGGLRRWSWAPAAAGVVAAGVGTYFLLQAEKRATALATLNTEAVGPDPRQYAEGAGTQRLGGSVLVAVGAAGVAAGALMFGFGQGSPVTPSAMLAPGGGFVGIAGVLP